LLAALLVCWVAAMLYGWHWLSTRPRPAAPTATAAASTAATPPPAAPISAASLFRTQPSIRPELALAPAELEPAALELAARGEHEEAAALWRRIVQIHAQDKSIERLPRAIALARLAASLSALERWEEADAAVERSQAILEELLPIRDPALATAFEMVGDYWASRERWPQAADAFRRGVEAYEKTGQENSIAQMMAVNRLAGALRQLGDLKTSEDLYRRLIRAFDGAGPGVAIESASASHNLANLLLQTDRPSEAREHYEKALGLLTRSTADEALASRMAVQMAPNYERALIASGIPPDEARIRALRATSRATATPLDSPPRR
jgi:tetratricopeptide (TPR) repeat protein